MLWLHITQIGVCDDLSNMGGNIRELLIYATKDENTDTTTTRPFQCTWQCCHSKIQVVSQTSKFKWVPCMLTHTHSILYLYDQRTYYGIRCGKFNPITGIRRRYFYIHHCKYQQCNCTTCIFTLSYSGPIDMSTLFRMPFSYVCSSY